MDELANDFYAMYYQFAITTAVRYLSLWFEQVFSAPEYKKLFKGWDNVVYQMAVATVSSLLGGMENKSPDENYKRAQKFAPKWADDIMRRDKDFCELIVQTARFDNIYQTYLEGDDWYERKDGGKITRETLRKYGGKVPQTPNPESYENLLKQWLTWSNEADKRAI